MELERDYNGFFSKLTDNMRKNLSKITEEMRNTDDYYILKVEKSDITNENCDNEKSKRKKIEVRFADVADLVNENGDSLKFKRKKIKEVCGTEENNGGGKLERTKSVMSFGDAILSDGSDTRRSSSYSEVYDDVVESKGVLKEEVFSSEKRQDFMLRWMANVAKNPTDPMVGRIPESSRWALYGSENCWKQVLLTREALFVKRDHRSTTEESVCQVEATGGPRSTARCLSEKTAKEPFFSSSSIGTPHETEANRGRPRQRLEARLDLKPTASIYTSRPQQRIPIGRPFQAEVPEWTGIPMYSDHKWYGTQVWPLKNSEPKFLIERDPIGKGRSDTCGCELPGSTACVKFHVAQRRMKFKVELGSAFYAWKFDNMGEECSVSWTIEEEKKFNAVVKNPLSLHECFWPQLFKVLPGKNWVDQVNYYFNVFVLRRRASQNRCNPSNIDSDNDETEFRGSPNLLGHDEAPSTFLFNSPSMKAHTNSK